MFVAYSIKQVYAMIGRGSGTSGNSRAFPAVGTSIFSTPQESMRNGQGDSRCKLGAIRPN